MFRKTLPALSIFFFAIGLFAQTKSYDSPNKKVHALIVAVGARGYETHESRLDIRASSGALLRSKSFWSRDHNHGEGVDHAEWTTDGRFFVFNTSSSGGHQPWHVSTYVYDARTNKLRSLDSIVGPITSDFDLRGSTLVTTRMVTNADEKVPVNIRLARLR
jgi:hypothetical protein